MPAWALRLCAAFSPWHRLLIGCLMIFSLNMIQTYLAVRGTSIKWSAADAPDPVVSERIILTSSAT